MVATVARMAAVLIGAYIIVGRSERRIIRRLDLRLAAWAKRLEGL